MRFLLAAAPLLAGLAVLAGCGASPALQPNAPANDPNELVMYANGSAVSLKMEGYRAWGPNAELKRFEGGYRGTFNGRIVDLHLEGDRVYGMIGASLVDLHVSGDGVQVHGQGILNGHISTFDVDDRVVDGSFGLCSYQLKRPEPKDGAPAKDVYAGYQSCNGSLYPTSRVTIPEYFRSLSALDQATLYTILLVG